MRHGYVQKGHRGGLLNVLWGSRGSSSLRYEGRRAMPVSWHLALLGAKTNKNRGGAQGRATYQHSGEDIVEHLRDSQIRNFEQPSLGNQHILHKIGSMDTW